MTDQWTTDEPATTVDTWSTESAGTMDSTRSVGMDDATGSVGVGSTGSLETIPRRFWLARSRSPSWRSARMCFCG